MATEEEIKRIINSEPEAKIEIHFRKEGMGLNFGNATPSQIIMAAVTLLNKAIDHEDTDWFVRVMAAVNELDKIRKQLDEAKEGKDEETAALDLMIKAIVKKHDLKIEGVLKKLKEGKKDE